MLEVTIFLKLVFVIIIPTYALVRNVQIILKLSKYDGNVQNAANFHLWLKYSVTVIESNFRELMFGRKLS